MKTFIKDVGAIYGSCISEQVSAPPTTGRFLGGLAGAVVFPVALAFSGATVHAAATISPAEMSSSQHAGAKILCLAKIGCP